jgi:hypothetical protein
MDLKTGQIVARAPRVQIINGTLAPAGVGDLPPIKCDGFCPDCGQPYWGDDCPEHGWDEHGRRWCFECGDYHDGPCE